VVDAIVAAASTGSIGDGKVWSTPGRRGGPRPHRGARLGSPLGAPRRRASGRPCGSAPGRRTLRHEAARQALLARPT
jgi:hypothetical protein